MLKIDTWWKLRGLQALAAYPFFHMVLFLVVWLGSAFGMVGMGMVDATGSAARVPEAVAGLFGVWMLVVMFTALSHVFTIFLMFLLLAFFLTHVLTNERLKDNERIMWVLACVFAGMIGQELYLFLVAGPALLGGEADPLLEAA